MNSLIAVLLVQDGLTNGAIYALLAIVLVMVFSITRIIFVPQGELISFAALTLAWFQTGRIPGTVWLVAAAACVIAFVDLYRYVTLGRQRNDFQSALAYLAIPLPIVAASYFAPGWPYWVQILVTIAVIVPMGPILYRIAFQPLASASVLMLLIVAIAVHFVLLGVGLLFFGAEGVRTPALVSARFTIGTYPVSGQAIFIWGIAGLLLVASFFFFGFTLWGKALRATAFNRVGARLVGIPSQRAGTLAFVLAGVVGAVSGILIAPLTTVYYDTGFLIGLKGFIAAIVGGLVSYPVAAIGALAIGLIETFSSFWASSFKDAIIFAAIIPILIWQNLFTAKHADDADEDEE